jgi:hypothetical protein
MTTAHFTSQRQQPRWRQLLATQRASRLPVVFVVLALPLVRPNLFGERYSLIGFGLLAMAALLAIVTRSASGTPAPTGPNPATPVVVCLGLAYLWLMIQAAATHPLMLGRPAEQGMVLTAGAVLCVAIVCREPSTRLALAKAFVVVIAVFCALYVVTVLIWVATGVGNGVLVSLDIGTSGINPIYLPLTPTVGIQSVFGTVFPRFTGLGREPGWMAMYCAAAYFMADAVGLRSRRLKALFLVGLVGCISTAGFGVFVVAWAYHVFLRDRGTGISVAAFLRQLSGILATILAIWLAVTAPVLGLAAKTTQNVTSLDERQLATEAGVRALLTSPLGGTATEVQGGINLISDIAVSGLPFVLLVCGALLLPALGMRGHGRMGNAVIVIVFLTMLTSQPAKDSTWAFALVAIAASLRAPIDEKPKADA